MNANLIHALVDAALLVFVDPAQGTYWVRDLCRTGTHVDEPLVKNHLQLAIIEFFVDFHQSLHPD